jgi:hypothetical protein
MKGKVIEEDPVATREPASDADTIIRKTTTTGETSQSDQLSAEVESGVSAQAVTEAAAGQREPCEGKGDHRRVSFDLQPELEDPRQSDESVHLGMTDVFPVFPTSHPAAAPK